MIRKFSQTTKAILNSKSVKSRMINQRTSTLMLRTSKTQIQRRTGLMIKKTIQPRLKRGFRTTKKRKVSKTTKRRMTLGASESTLQTTLTGNGVIPLALSHRTLTQMTKFLMSHPLMTTPTP